MKILKIATIIFLFLFGLITIFMGGAVIFDLFGLRAIEGNYVLFVVWANWICGFLYISAAIGLIRNKKWAIRLLWFATVLLVFTFIEFFVYIKGGGLHETKTVFAMTFRTIITLVLALLSHRIVKHNLNWSKFIKEK